MHIPLSTKCYLTILGMHTSMLNMNINLKSNFQHVHMYATQLCCIVMGVLNACVEIDAHGNLRA
jgi:hypothetical protein